MLITTKQISVHLKRNSYYFIGCDGLQLLYGGCILHCLKSKAIFFFLCKIKTMKTVKDKLKIFIWKKKSLHAASFFTFPSVWIECYLFVSNPCLEKIIDDLARNRKSSSDFMFQHICEVGPGSQSPL